jgi:hypothetical protein
VPSDAEKLNALYAQQRKDRQQIKDLHSIVDELKGIVEVAADAPKWIEDIPGKRVPFIASIEINIDSGTTTRVEGQYPVTQDGPFVTTGMAMFWTRTSGAYQGYWMPATTYGMRMAMSSQQLGYGGLFDNPCVASFDVEVSDSGSDRNWQNISFASALFNPESGGIYMWPTAYMFATNSVARVYVTPTVAPDTDGTVAVLLLGYKIVQGVAYQP